MALRGTLTHRKTRRLGSLMHIPACFALGIVESLWHVTGEQAPTGAIGKMTDEDIAMEMFYDGDASAMVLALVQSGFLEPNEEHRLIVHDWHIHSDDATDNKLSRNGMRYANGELPRMRRLSLKEREKACARYEEPCAQMRTETHEMPLPEPESCTRVQSQSPVPEPEKEQEPLSIPSTAAAVKSAEVVTIWNELTQGKLPHAKSSLNRQKVIQTRLKEPGWLPDFRAACAYLAETPWYTGHNDRQWVATIDFALQAGKATELAEKATQQAPQSAGAMNHGNVQHHRTATDQRYIDQLAARDERRAREATEHPEAALPVLQ